MNSDLSCSNCDRDVDGSASHCPHCGALFDQAVSCAQHPEEEADGVCVVCSTPCCSDCGRWFDNTFLCGDHEAYEILEGRVRVFSSADPLSAEYARRLLEQAGFHPVVASGPAGTVAAGVSVLVPFVEADSAGYLLRGLALPPP